jgi:hypothetical protein
MPVRHGGPAVDVNKIRPQDDGNAFLPDPRETGQSRTRDDLAETLAEEFLEAATSAEEQMENDRDKLTLEELGGPFVEASAAEEFAEDIDGTNPEGATREPFPTAVRAPKG